MGGERDGTRGRFLEMPHRPSSFPAGRKNVLAEGSQPLQYGRRESRIRDGHRQAGRSRRAEGGIRRDERMET